MGRLRAMVGGGVVAGLCVFSASSVNADPYAAGYPDSGFKPDSDVHGWCMQSDYRDRPAAVDGAIHAFDTLQEQTTMGKDRQSDCGSGTDVAFRKGSISGDGSYRCLDFETPNRCNAARVIIDFGSMSGDNDFKQTACHETGHSVGLTHGGGDCMGYDPNEKRYSDHHRQHINQDRNT